MAATKRRNSQQSDLKQRIIAALDIRAEYAAMGIEFTGEERPNGWIECYSRGRDEAKPSAAVNVRSGYYLDSSDEHGENLGFFDFAIKYGGQPNFRAALKHYATKAGVELKRGAERSGKSPIDWFTAEPWNDALAGLWCLKKSGLTVEAIKSAGGWMARYPRTKTKTEDGKEVERPGKFKTIVLPVYGLKLLSADPVGYVAWNITGGPLLAYSRNRAKPPREVKMKSHGTAGLMNLHGLARMATGDPAGKIIWKTAGPTDGMALQAVIPAELRDTHLVIWNSGGENETGVPEAFAGVFAGWPVYIVHDADEAGESGAAKWLSALIGCAAEVRQVRLPYEITAKHGKDLRDFFNEGHTYQELLDLAAATKPATLADIAAHPEAFPPRFSTNGHGNSSPGGQAEQNNSDFGSSGPPQAGQVETESEIKALESDDDPHRLARMFQERYSRRTGHHAVLHFWREEWWRWNGRIYRPMKVPELRAEVTSAVKSEFDRLHHRLQSIGADDCEVQKVTRPLVSNVIGALEGMAVLGSDCDQPAWLTGNRSSERRNYIALKNGILDLDRLLAGEPDVLLPHSPQWFSTVCLPYEFDPYAACPKWVAFLRRVMEGDPQRLALLQEWAGYMLLPDTGQQRFMALEGEGANGKSVYCAAIEAMLGSENVSHVPLELFGQRFALTQTLGKLANIAAEVGELDKIAEGFLKSFTSGDRMSFDRKHLPPIDATPTARLMIATNNRPRFSDRSGGIWRRILLVPFRVTIGEAERVFGMDKPTWWEASGELPGIFNWAIAGLHRLRQQGTFTKSDVCSVAVDEYQLEVNPVRRFLSEHYEFSEVCKTTAATLYQAYQKWCQENGHHPFSEIVFGREVKRKFPEMERKKIIDNGKRVWAYIGVAAKSDTELF